MMNTIWNYKEDEEKKHKFWFSKIECVMVYVDFRKLIRKKLWLNKS